MSKENEQDLIGKLSHLLNEAKSREELYKLIVNAPFQFRREAAELFLGIIVLLIENKETKEIDRVALSNTELADYTKSMSKIPFYEIKIPVKDEENIIAKAIRTGQPQDTTDWKYLFTPVLTAQEARLNQASGGIACSFVYPLIMGDKRGAIIFSYFQYLHAIGEQQERFMAYYSAAVSARLLRPNSGSE